MLILEFVNNCSIDEIGAPTFDLVIHNFNEACKLKGARKTMYVGEKYGGERNLEVRNNGGERNF